LPERASFAFPKGQLHLATPQVDYRQTACR